MRAGQIGAVALLLQSSLVLNLRTAALPEHLRYQRAIHLASASSGTACVSLDATTLAHTASPAHTDLRIFRRLAGEPEAELPYLFTESGPEPVADTAATPQHVVAQGSELSFDLPMPPRPYSEVRLPVALTNFVATATLEGQDRGGRRVPMGRVGLYDLSAAHLGRWTDLLFAEASWPVLHVVLDLRTPEGAPLPGVSAAAVPSAEVPPSRLRQTRYVPTVHTQAMHQQGVLSVATLRVPAHVPVERVAFTLPAAWSANFAREVTVSAKADGAPVSDTEALDAGAITVVHMPSGDDRLAPIDIHEEALDATLGATLAHPATVLVAVANLGATPLPLQAVTLEMRERKLCFFADREGSYVLRYGDSDLPAPAYDETAVSSTATLAADLGPEQRNPGYRGRRTGTDSWRRHPEWFWLLVLLSAGSMGGSALHYVQHRRD